MRRRTALEGGGSAGTRRSRPATGRAPERHTVGAALICSFAAHACTQSSSLAEARVQVSHMHACTQPKHALLLGGILWQAVRHSSGNTDMLVHAEDEHGLAQEH